MSSKDRSQKLNHIPMPDKTKLVRSTATTAAFLFLITTLIFSRSLFNDFIYSYDDELYVAGNKDLANGITFSSLAYIVKPGVIANWHPVTMFSHALDVELFGLAPWGHHLTSVLLHAVNTVLLFMLLRGVTGAHWRSAAVAGLFALHPLHVQSVAMVAQRKDLLSTLFLFLAIHSYATRRPGDRLMLRTAFWLVLSLLSKPMAVTFPFLLLLIDYWPLSRFTPAIGDRRKNLHDGLALIVEKFPLFATIAVMSVITLLVQRDYGATATLSGLPLHYRLHNVILSYAEYLKLTVWPSGLSAFYPYPLVFSMWKTGAAAFALIVVTAVAAIQWKKAPYFVTGWLWYLGSLVPVIGIIQVGTQAMADRYTYIPLIGIFVAVVWGLHDLLSRESVLRKASVALCAVVLVAMATKTWFEIGYWANAESLWKRALAVTTNNYKAHFNLESRFVEEGRWEEAVEHGYIAIGMTPTPGGKPQVEPFLLLGRALQALARPKEGLDVLLKGKELYPEHPGIYFELGSCYMMLGQHGEAEDILRQLPGSPSKINEMTGNVYLNAREFDRAEQHYLQAIQSDPKNAMVHVYYAQCLELKGQPSDALKQYELAVELDPTLAPRLQPRIASLQPVK